MFKNCVFKVSVDTKKWFKAAAVRAVKTMAQTALSLMTVGAAMSDIDWALVASVSVTSGIASALTSLAGIPEVSEKVEEE